MKQTESKITGLLTLVLLTVFALCILVVLLMGARGYEALVHRDGQTYARRTVAQYLATRVRQGDTLEGMAVADFGGHSTLVLRQEIEGDTYLTRIYCHEGFLRELFTAEGGSFSPEDGEKLLELQELSFAMQEDLLTACVTMTDGQVQTLCWHLRAGEVLP